MKRSLSSKVFAGFLVLLTTFGLLALLSVREIRALADDLRSITEGQLALARLGAQLWTHQQNRFRDLDRGLQESDRRMQEVVLRIALAYFPDLIRATLEETRGVCQKQMVRNQALNNQDSATKIAFYRGILKRIDRIAEQHEEVNELTRNTIARLKAGEPIDDVPKRIEQIEVPLRSETYELNKYISDETDRAVRRADQEERHAVWRVIATTSSGVVVGLLLTLISARALAPIAKLAQYARAISRGDYEQTVDTHGQPELASLAEELQRMARSRKDRENELDRQTAQLEIAYRRVADLKRYHESVVRSLRTAVVVTDRDLIVTSSNRAAETHWGGRGQPLESLSIGPPLVQALGPLSALVTSKETVTVRAIALGERRADITIAPFQNELGDVLGLVLAIEDVTEAIRMKDALIRSERLAAIGRMSAHVTHEIRNPLSSIGLNAELLESLTAGGPTAAGSAERNLEAQILCRAIVREVDRLTAITDEYLRFARLPRPHFESTDVMGLLASIAHFVEHDFKTAGVRIQLHAPPGPHQARIFADLDPDQIRQAVLNLLKNAKESMPSGGQIDVHLRNEADTLAILIRDAGAGIPQEDLDHIFDPFFSTKLTGTGLGLSLTQQIVTDHGGHLEVASKVGNGSGFTIVLPQYRAHTPIGSTLIEFQSEADPEHV